MAQVPTGKNIELVLIDTMIAALQKYRDDQSAAARAAAVLQAKEADPFFADKKTKRLAEFFFRTGYFIVKTQEKTGGSYKLAKQIWAGRPVTLDFILQFRKKSNADGFSYPLTELDAAARNTLHSLCQALQAKEWLSFEFQKDTLEIRNIARGEEKNYLTGGWAEDVTRYLIAKTLHDSSHPSARIWQDIQLKPADPADASLRNMQLDCLVEFPDRVYIFETKSGFVLSIDKWVDRARLFGQAPNRFITCCADETLNPMIFKPFLLFALPRLEEQFRELLENDFPSPEKTPEPPKKAANPPKKASGKTA